jgi:hypothetical protein
VKAKLELNSAQEGSDLGDRERARAIKRPGQPRLVCFNQCGKSVMRIIAVISSWFVHCADRRGEPCPG